MPPVVETRSLHVVLALLLVPALARAQEEPIDIVVTGRRSPERLGESAVAVEVITREQIVTSGARDAAQILANQPGIQIDSSFRGEAIQMQGLDPQHTLILVDGERLIGARDGALDLTRLFAGDIERIEIVRGPASAIYGSDAIAGVVNVITRLPRKNPAARRRGATAARATAGSRATRG
jgi:outer membrane receptor for ferrienterochelin and colicins